MENENFIQAHEVLEDDWREYKKTKEKFDESLILKGLINGATSLALYRLKRAPEFQVKPWAAFIRYSKLIESCNSIFKSSYEKAETLLIKKDKLIRPEINLPVEKYI